MKKRVWFLKEKFISEKWSSFLSLEAHGEDKEEEERERVYSV